MPRYVNPKALVEEFEEVVRQHAFRGTLVSPYEKEALDKVYELRKERLLRWIEDHK